MSAARRPPPGARLVPYALSLPALLVCVGILIPFGTAVYYSMQRYIITLPFTRGFVWFGQYADLFTDKAFWHTVRISLLYTALTVGLELVIGLAVALMLRKPTRINNILGVALMLPLMVAPVIATLMWKLMTDPSFGILSHLLSLVGVENFRWAADPDTALLTVVLVDVWVYTPFMIVLLLAGLRSLPPQPFEAAELDGVPKLFVFFRVTLPMLTPYIITACLFRMLDSIQQFDIIYGMTKGGPGDSLKVFQVQAYLEFYVANNVGRSAAVLMVLWLITFVISHFFIRRWLALRQKLHGRRAPEGAA